MDSIIFLSHEAFPTTTMYNQIMIDPILREIGRIGTFLKQNYSETAVISLATLFLILSEYHSIGARWSDALLFYALLPLLTIIFLLRKNPLDFGLRFGKFKTWRIHVAVVCLVALPILFIASRFSSLEEYYVVQNVNLPRYFIKAVIYQASWEFIFRGFLLFGLKEKFREGSILIQMIPFLFMHLGKPEIEVISTIPMGLYFGYVAYHGNSYWPAFFIHLFINISFRIMVNWL